MRATRITQNIVLGIIAALGAASIVFVAVVMIFGLRPADVVSGSMRPTLPVGSVVLTKQVPAATLKAGEIVQVPRASDGTVVTHRIQSVTKTDAGYQLTLKGDANKMADPQTYTVTTAGLYQGHIPYLGYGAQWVKAYPVYTVLILLGLLAFSFWGRAKVSVRLADGKVIDGLSKREAESLVAHLEAQQAASAQTAVAAEPEPAPVPAPEPAAAAPERRHIAVGSRMPLRVHHAVGAHRARASH